MTNEKRIRSRCEWFEHGEKSTKLFLNPEKHRATKNQIGGILFENKKKM